MEDERDAEDAIRALDRYEFGRKGRQLRVEWTKQERTLRQPVSSRKSSSNSRPSKTLFVINFDPYNTRTKDLEKHFDPYGKIMNIRIRRNFAFIQFELQEEATKALESTNMSKLMDRVISVEYAVKNDDDRKTRNSPGGRERSPRRRNDDRGRSPSPYRRERGSPDYGRGRDRTSPDNGRRRGRSPSPNRRDRVSPAYGRGSSPGANGKGKARNADYRRDASLSPHLRDRDRVSPDNGRGSSPGANGKGRVRNADYSRDTSPSPRRGRGRSSRESIPKEKASPSPRRGRERSPRESIPKEKASPEYEQGAISSPQSEGRVRPNDYPRAPSPDPKPDIRDSPGYTRAESPPERYRSRSPSARDRSRS